MADSTIDSEQIILSGAGVAGFRDRTIGRPTDGFTSATHHNVASPVYPVGTMVDVYNKGNTGVAGGATFVYAQAETQDLTNVIAARMFLTTYATTPVWWKFTNDAGADIGDGIGPLVVALSAMTLGYYGWFWCAGVCPEEFVSDLDGVYYTKGDVAIGPFTGGTLATPGTIAGEIGLTAIAADTSLIAGWALSADT